MVPLFLTYFQLFFFLCVPVTRPARALSPSCRVKWGRSSAFGFSAIFSTFVLFSLPFLLSSILQVVSSEARHCRFPQSYFFRFVNYFSFLGKMLGIIPFSMFSQCLDTLYHLTTSGMNNDEKSFMRRSVACMLIATTATWYQ